MQREMKKNYENKTCSNNKIKWTEKKVLGT